MAEESFQGSVTTALRINHNVYGGGSFHWMWGEEDGGVDKWGRRRMKMKNLDVNIVENQLFLHYLGLLLVLWCQRLGCSTLRCRNKDRQGKNSGGVLNRQGNREKATDWVESWVKSQTRQCALNGEAISIHCFCSNVNSGFNPCWLLVFTQWWLALTHDQHKL